MIEYINGDATLPQIDGKKIIAHVCNDVGGWDRGFVVSLSKRWSQPEKNYREWAAKRVGGVKLGRVQFVDVGDDVFVANMVAQHGVKNENGIPPIRYDALKTCLMEVKNFTVFNLNNEATVHMPRIGCGLAGGKWNEIEPIINEMLWCTSVYVYDYVSSDSVASIPWNP
jgi:O-acetyl-ADP-ribose deacetylase (regulator of RNase III)